MTEKITLTFTRPAFLTSAFWSDAFTRAVRTGLYTLSVSIPVQSLGTLDWINALQVAGIASLLSIITSIVNLPAAVDVAGIKLISIEALSYAAERAIKTLAQTALAFLIVDLGVESGSFAAIDWQGLLTLAIPATAVSVIRSLYTISNAGEPTS